MLGTFAGEEKPLQKLPGLIRRVGAEMGIEEGFVQRVAAITQRTFEGWQEEQRKIQLVEISRRSLALILCELETKKLPAVKTKQITITFKPDQHIKSAQVTFAYYRPYTRKRH
jgi:hypothetical protein